MNYGLTIGIIPIAGTQFTKTSEIETPSLRFPLLAGGTEPTRPTRFPSRSGGNHKEGGNCKLCPCDWYQRSPHSKSMSPQRQSPDAPVGYT